MTTINVKKINDKAILPTYGSEYAAGADLYACLDEPLTIKPHETVMVHTGLAMEIPAGYAGLIYPRSGLASKRGLAPANKVGVVDPDYRGEFMILPLSKHGALAFVAHQRAHARQGKFGIHILHRGEPMC